MKAKPPANPLAKPKVSSGFDIGAIALSKKLASKKNAESFRRVRRNSLQRLQEDLATSSGTQLRGSAAQQMAKASEEGGDEEDDSSSHFHASELGSAHSLPRVSTGEAEEVKEEEEEEEEEEDEDEDEVLAAASAVAAKQLKKMSPAKASLFKLTNSSSSGKSVAAPAPASASGFGFGGAVSSLSGIAASKRLAKASTKKLAKPRRGSVLGLQQQRNVCVVQDLEALKTVQFPDSMHALMMERLDQLPRKALAALELASVVGQTFSVEAVHHLCVVTERKDLQGLKQVRAVLGSMSKGDNRLLRPLRRHEAASLSDATQSRIDDSLSSQLAFEQKLALEVAYKKMTFEQRQHCHRLLALYYEQEQADAGAEALLKTHASGSALAYHWGLSGNLAKQIDYLESAAADATRMFDPASASKHLQALVVIGEEALGLHSEDGAVGSSAAKMSADAEVRSQVSMRQLSSFRARLGRSLLQLGRVADAEEQLWPAFVGFGAAAERPSDEEMLAMFASALPPSPAELVPRGLEPVVAAALCGVTADIARIGFLSHAEPLQRWAALLSQQYARKSQDRALEAKAAALATVIYGGLRLRKVLLTPAMNF